VIKKTEDKEDIATPIKISKLLLEKAIPLIVVWGLVIIFWDIFGIFGGRFSLVLSVGGPLLVSLLILRSK